MIQGKRLAFPCQKRNLEGKKIQIFSSATLYLFILIKNSRVVVLTFPIGHGPLPGQSGEI